MEVKWLNSGKDLLTLLVRVLLGFSTSGGGGGSVKLLVLDLVDRVDLDTDSLATENKQYQINVYWKQTDLKSHQCYGRRRLITHLG